MPPTTFYRNQKQPLSVLCIEFLSKVLSYVIDDRPATMPRLTLEETFNNHKMGRVEKAAMSSLVRMT